MCRIAPGTRWPADMELPPSVDFSLPEVDSEELIRHPVCRMHALSLPKSGGAPLSRPLRAVLRPSEVIGAIGGVSRETPPHRATDESPSPSHSIANRGVTGGIRKDHARR